MVPVAPVIYYWYHVCFHIPNTLNFSYEVFVYCNLLSIYYYYYYYYYSLSYRTLFPEI